MKSGDESGEFAAKLRTCVEVLEAIALDRTLLTIADTETRRRLSEAAGRVSKPDRASARKLAKAFRVRGRTERRAADDRLLESAEIRVLRRAPVFPTPTPVGELEAPSSAEAGSPSEAEDVLREPKNCYVCKVPYRRVHSFYDQLCEACAELNWRKRHQAADVSGRVAIVTGARVKIGYQAAIMLLRAGATVLVTTRFPHDAAKRYAQEADFDVWGDRLHVYGLDLRHTPSVDAFARHVCATYERLDFLVNNACQTVRRPPGFYAHLLADESGPARELPPRAQRALADYDALRGAGASGAALAARAGGFARAAGLHDPAALSQLVLAPGDDDLAPPLFPHGQLDQDLQQVDLRTMNSWRLTLAEVPVVELLEVHLVNAVAPFVLNARLKPLMIRQRTFDKHIVNVSAMEGQFYRAFKTDKHPHTNMAKAALNMMTRTSSSDYAADGIYMNSVDTGWVTDEDPVAIAERKVRDHRFYPPLDVVDGAARILDPIFSGLLERRHVFGKFLKDYAETNW